MSDDRQLPRCDRTDHLRDRVVEDRVTPDDREHAETCAACGAVLMRSARFDAELGRVARGLVVERLPDGVLDDDLAPGFAPGLPSMRTGALGIASVLVAVVVLVLGPRAVLAPGGPGDSAPPSTSLGMSLAAFRAPVDISHDLDALGYSCFPALAFPGSAPSTLPGSESESVRCLTPKTIEHARATMIAFESDGQTDQVIVEGALYGADSDTSRGELAATLGKIAFVSITDPQAAADAEAFVRSTLPKLGVMPNGGDAGQTFAGVQVLVEHTSKVEYLLILTPA